MFLLFSPIHSSSRTGQTPIEVAIAGNHTEIVKFLALLTRNPNTLMTGHSDGWIQTHESALIENPNATPNKTSWTLIHEAAHEGNTEIVRILAPLSKNPNTPDKDGWTPIYLSAMKGFTEIVNILAALTDNPNSTDETGWSPIHEAATEGYTEIVKILSPLTQNPNSPDKFGNTPIHEAAGEGNPESNNLSKSTRISTKEKGDEE